MGGWGLAEAPGETLELRIHDRVWQFSVRGVLKGAGFQAASAETSSSSTSPPRSARWAAGAATRIQVHTPEGDERDWAKLLSTALPEGVEVYAAGAKTEENRKMLGAFRWNLRVLSWISLIVGAFLIYQHDRGVGRAPASGDRRAAGIGRDAVPSARGVLGRSRVFGAVGDGAGAADRRWMASGAVEMMALTVRTLYVSGEAGGDRDHADAVADRRGGRRGRRSARGLAARQRGRPRGPD